MNAVAFLEHLRSQGVAFRVEGDLLRYRAPRGTLTQDLLDQIRDLKPELLRILSRADAPPPSPAGDDRIPLSYGQRALWFLHQRDPLSAAYHVAFATRIRSPVRSGDLEACFRFLVDRHASLRTTYSAAGGEPFQRIGPRRDPVLETVAAADCDLPELRRRVIEAYRRPFDLERGPLLRASLFTRNPQDHVLLLTIHHIACDGWSLWLLQDELGEVYRAIRAGRTPTLPPLRQSYADFVTWQSERLRSVEGEADWAYWRDRLSGPLPALELPWDRPRPPVREARGASLPFSLSAALTEKLRAYARRRGATLYAVLAAAFQVLLHRHTGQQELLLGTPTSGRSRTEFQNLVGFFVNPIVLRSDLGGDPSFDDHLDRIRRQTLDALNHQDFPFPVLVDRLHIERDLSRTPVFQALFALQRPQMQAAVEALVVPTESDARLTWDDLVLEPFHIPQQEGQFDFSLEMLESRHTLGGLFKYNTDVLDRVTVDRARMHFRRLLEDIVDHSHKRLSELMLLDDDERHRLLQRHNDTATAYPRTACIHELFEHQARDRPDAIAVEFQGTSLTYAELDERGNQVAHFLRRQGVGEKRRIGVCLSRSPEMLIALLGILKSGCGYVPLDPDYPEQRLAAMLQDSRAATVITGAEHARLFHSSAALVLCLDSQAGEIAALQPTRLPGSRTAATDVAYVMFTSGSTGQPKGVAVAHRGVVRLIQSTNAARFGSDEIWLQIAPLGFDASTLEIWGALLNGGKLVIAPAGPLSLEDLGRLVAATGITSLLLTAGLFHQQVDFGLTDFASVRQFFAGGDVVSAPHVRRGLEQLPGCRFINAYGPTENTTIATCHPITAAADVGHSVPIGRPISNTRVYVLDARLEPVPEGVAGELYLAGDGLALGYVSRPDWTAERFIPDPFAASPGDRMYKTGDRARWRADGNLEFLGRLDQQVKIRGFRIEPAEIEAALTACDGVREATVVVHRDVHEIKRLVAYLTAGRPEPPASETLRSALAARLPEYMIPAQFVWLAALPLTVNGKVDRSALPAPGQLRPRLEQELLPPTTPTEVTLAEIWKRVLGVETVGIRDNFFALGGHSLLATQVVSRIKQQWGIELPLLRVFDHATIAELAALIDDHAGGEESANPAILPVSRETELPLSFAQERLWIVGQLEPDHAFYNIPAAVRIHGRLDPNVLRDCLQAVVRRHESLRTTFATVQGQAVQRVAAAVPVELPVVDLTRLPRETRDAEAMRLGREEAGRPFDLAVGPLFRFRLLRLSEADFVFLLTLHHIVADGWSMGVLVSELVELYRGRTGGPPARLPDLPIQYPDFAVWQRRHLTDEAQETQLAYWREQLRALPTLNLPLDRPRPAVQTFAGGTRSLRLDRGLVDDLERLSQGEDSTLSMTMLAAFQLLLVRYTGQSDIAVGSGIANRNRPELEPLIGFFVNLQVLRTQVDRTGSFRDLLRRVRHTCLAAYDHQDVPFDRIVRELQPNRTANYNPLCQVCLVFQNFPLPEIKFPGLSIQEMTVAAGTAKFDLTLYLEPDRTGLAVELEYNTDLFDPDTIERMLHHYATLLRSVADDPDRPVRELEIFSAAERNGIFVERNRTDVALAGPDCVHQWFARQVARTPHAPAILFGDEQLSYEDLHCRASGWAAELRRLGVGRGTLVGLCLERSPELLVGMLAILEAGGAYVPLDPTCPPDRLGFMLRDCGAGLLITSVDLQPRLPPFEGRILHAEALGSGGPEPTANLRCVNEARDLAYLIYTSGSTGRPKGVALEHRGLCNLMACQKRVLGIGPADRVLQFASASFDASVWEIFVTLTAGATVCLAPREAMLDGDGLIAWLRRHAVTIATIPPSVLAVLPDDELPDLRIIISAGEPCDRTLVRRWRTPSRRFINAYGPTEGTVCGTLADCDPDDRQISIGSPIDNVQAFVLDPWLEPVPDGVVGELYLGGLGLARGYWNRPDLTAAAFIPNPFTSGGERLYKTGDAARWLPDGRLEFRGRLDQQVKIRGFRIELEEIEAVLREHPEVRDAAVVVATDGGTHPRLVAQVVCRPRPPAPPSGLAGSREEDCHGRDVCDDDLRAWLRQRLPDYMVPSVIHLLEAMPLTPTGKIDRQALAASSHRPGSPDNRHRAPRTEPERRLAEAWREVLGVEEIGIDENFFELGGDSILGMRLVTRIRARGLSCSPLQLFQYQTIAELAAVVEPAGLPTADQGEISGAVELTPIQHWFLDDEPVEPAHFNQSLLLKTDPFVDLEHLEAAVAFLPVHHDALRLRFRRREGRWEARHAPASGVSQPEASEAIVERIDLAGIADTHLGGAIEAACTRVQASLDLEHGPLFRALHISLGPSRPGRLLLVIHHLVVDAVSWSILLQDLVTAYRQRAAGQAIALPPKTTSFQAWSRRLHHLAATRLPDPAEPAANLPLASDAESFPCTHDRGSNTVASSATLSLVLDSTETKQLLERAAFADHVRIDELLAAAFASGYHRWCSRSRVAIDLESHGREDLFGDLDLSRTVGWFTSLLPLVLTVPAGGEATAVLDLVKNQLRARPHRGIHAGISRYLRDEREGGGTPASGVPEVALNYLGRMDRLTDLPDDLFSLAPESTGPHRCPAAVRRHLLEITSWITVEGLRVDWTYSRNLQTEASVRALAGCFRDALLEIVRCPPPAAGRPTPADFPHATVTQAQLDRLAEHGLDLEDVYDATPTQAGILYHAQAAPASGIYVMQLSGRVSGSRAIESLAEAWLEVIRRHPILRTSFWWTDVEKPLQLVHRRAELPVERHDWRGLAASAHADALERYLREDRERPLDLAFGPLVHLTLIRVDEDEYRFVWTHHHLLLDGWSLPLVLRDLIDAFERIHAGGRRDSPPPPRFRDYIAWLRNRDAEASTAFWRAALAGFTTPTPLGIDRPGAASRRPARFEQRVLRLPAGQTGMLKELARGRRLTLNTVVQGIWAVLLSRYSGQADVVFGSTVSGRSATIRGIESMVGMFINTLPTRISVRGDRRWSDWLAGLQQQQVALREHEHLALQRIQEVSDIRRGSPLFESLLVFENYPIDDSLLGELGSKLPVSDLRFDERTHYPLTLTVDPGAELRITIGYDAERFDAAAIDRLTTHLESVVAQVIADPDVRLSDICMLGPDERRRVAVEFNRTAAEYPRDRGVAELFEAAAASTPNHIAVTVGGIDCTYATLNARANQCARQLQSLGVRPGDRVGVCLDRSQEMMVALLGILKAGAAYVPLDPGFPAERLRFMLRDARVSLLVTQRSLAAAYQGLAPAVLCMDDATEPLAGHATGNLPPLGRAGDLAYLIYTSGSTGRPKGVHVSHAALANLLTSMQRMVEIDSTDTLLAVTTISFDIAALELYLPLLVGGRVVIAEGRQTSDGMALRDLLEESRATIMQATPATWRMMLEAGWQPGPDLRILVGGEALELRLARRLVGAGRRVWNVYGPTETTVWSTAARLEPGLDRVTIGNPIANTQVFLLDAHLQMVPVGVAGELYIGGAGLARGYWNRPDVTAARFVPNPHGTPPGGRIYRTGDLCRWLPDGSLEFLGRLDDQVKIRGHRIELGEVEGVLALHPAIREAAAAVRPDDSGEAQLVAYLRPVTDARPSVSHLRTFLRSKLPDFMVPASFVFLETFPRTANGKLDRRSLPEPSGARPDLDPPYVAPRTPLEASLAAIWSEVLGIEQVGIHDNFFDLGGASMNALRIVAKARLNGLVADPSLFRPELLFEHPTIAAWAALIDEQKP
jgi:amino acid adenylation domain-containing protein/non-ribosomal peptide synthase protein (TIGR01720 family)